MAPTLPKSSINMGLLTAGSLAKNNPQLVAEGKKKAAQKAIADKITQGIATTGQVNIPVVTSPVKTAVQDVAKPMSIEKPIVNPTTLPNGQPIVAGNISPEQLKGDKINQLGQLSDKEIQFAKEAKSRGYDINQVADFIHQKRSESTNQVDKSILSKIGGVAQDIGGGALSSLIKTGELATRPIQYLGNKLNQGIDYVAGTNTEPFKLAGTTRENIPQVAGDVTGGNPQSLGFKGGELAGDIATSSVAGAAGAGLLGSALGGTQIAVQASNIANKFPKIASVAKLAGQGALDTQAYNVQSEGKLATPGETALGAGAGLAAGAIGKIGKLGKETLYNSAFSQAPDRIKKDLAKYGKTAGQAVLNEGLPSRISKGLLSIKDNLKNTRGAIETAASTAGNIEGKSIKVGIKQDLVDKLGYNKLNQESQSTKDLIKNISSIVDDIVPDGSITPKELLEQVKQINSNLPNTLLGKGFQDAKGNKRIEKVIALGLKNVLNDSVNKSGGEKDLILKLYSKYGEQKTVEAILQNESVRKILGRQLAGGVGGAGVGAVAGYEDFKQGDVASGLGKVAAFSLLGSQVTKLIKDPSFLSWLGKRLGESGQLVKKYGAKVGAVGASNSN